MFSWTSLTQMNVDVAIIQIAIHQRTLPNSPHHSRLGRKRSQEIALPALLTSPPVLILGEVEGIGRLDAGLVHVLGFRPLAALWWVAEDVDVGAALVAVGGDVAVLGGLVGVPYPALVAEALDHAGRAVLDLDLADSGVGVVFVFVLGLLVCCGEKIVMRDVL
mgnify:CR=1 FL=1